MVSIKARFRKFLFSSTFGAVMVSLAVCLWLAGCHFDIDDKSVVSFADNLIVICIDTLRADHVGTYGYGRDTTPTIDRLAAGGVVFENTVAQSNWTVPTTATILTSLYPSEHGARIEAVPSLLGKDQPSNLRPKVRTLGGVLRYYGFRNGLFSANPYLRGRFKRGFQVAEVRRRDATKLTDLALQWLEEAPSERFFLYLQYIDLHDPVVPPEPYFEYFETPEAGVRTKAHSRWRYLRSRPKDATELHSFRSHRIAVYDGALRYIDAEIGRLLSGLKTMGVLEESVVVVTSDHGEEFWEHADIEKRLRLDPRGVWGVGHGHSMFQELLHVPLIIAGPGIPQARLSCASRQLDIAPTALSLLGLPPHPQHRGTDLSALWASEADRRDCSEVPQVAETTAYGPETTAIVWQGFKLITSGSVELLYDLENDPTEQRDLSEERPEMVELLRTRVEAELSLDSSFVERFGNSEKNELDAETRRQLIELGYVSDD